MVNLKSHHITLGVGNVQDNMDIVVIVDYNQEQERDLTRFLLKYG